MKYVYVLTSTPNDLYYEQCLMSVASLRLYMPDADVIVLTDNRTAASFTEEQKRTELGKTASQIIVIDFDESIGNAERSRLIKTSIPDYVNDDFLYIDCDTIIAGDLSPIENCPYETAGVLDGHVMLDEHIHKKYFLQRDKALGFHGTEKAGCNINGGNWFELWSRTLCAGCNHDGDCSCHSFYDESSGKSDFPCHKNKTAAFDY